MPNPPQSLLPWRMVEDSLDTLQEVAGGYSRARRGVITLPGHGKAFVKIGTDDTTKKWAAREVVAYRTLASHGYRHIPSLLATNTDDTGFAIEALLAADGWDWTDTWTEARLAATLAAMDDVSEIILTPAQRAYFATNTINETQDGWKQLAANPNTQRILIEKLRQAGRENVAKQLDIAAAAKRSTAFIFSQDTLVHNDVRADNCAWNPAGAQVKFVDWNWAQLGDRRFDTGAFLVNVQKAGLDVTVRHADRLDKDALHWLAGYWLNAAAQPLPLGGSEKATLREYQLSSGIAALQLLKLL